LVCKDSFKNKGILATFVTKTKLFKKQYKGTTKKSIYQSRKTAFFLKNQAIQNNSE